MTSPRLGKKLCVIHSFPVWLPQTQTWMYNQVRYLPEEIETHIVCEQTENLDQFEVPNIHALENSSRWRWHWDQRLRMHGFRKHLGFLVAQAKKIKADIIHSHFGNVGWADMGAVKRVGARHVVTFYGLDVNWLPTIEPVWRNRYRELFAQVARVLCEGPHMARCVVELGCPEEKVTVQHLGVRIDEIPFHPRSRNPDEPLRVLIAASFREKKGIPYALEALGRFQEEVPLEITIIGDAGHEARNIAEKEKILAVIEKYGLGPKTRLLGYQPHAVFFEEAYRSDVFLSPSVTAADGDTEGGAPVSLIEMAAAGVPVIATAHCDIPEVIRHDETGLLAEERDVNGLVEHLRFLVSHPERIAAMAARGRKHVEQEFSAQIQGQKLAGIYRDLG